MTILSPLPVLTASSLPFHFTVHMFTRINFLLGFGLLVMILFYFAFSYLVILPLSVIAPGWARIAAGGAVLVSVGLTVQILSIAMSKLAGVATYPQGPNALAIASQGAIVCGHGALGYAMASWMDGGPLPGDIALALIGALYAAGVAIGIRDGREHATVAP